jgi:hypothetical protein
MAKTQDGTALGLMNWRVNMGQQWHWWDIPRIFVRIGAFRRNLACYVRKSPGVFTPESTLSQAGGEYNSC